MALDLGELSGRISLDIAPVRKGAADAKTEIRGIADEADAAGGEAGERFGDSFGDTAKTAAAAAGVAVGAAIAYGVSEGLSREAGADRMAAQLGLDPREQARLGRVAGTLYANAYGESFEDVTTAIGAVRSSIQGLDDNQSLRRATARALNYATTFEVDVARAVQVAGQLINTGLVENNRAAFDLITAGSQQVPAAVREDLLDASDEYGQFFQALGMDGKDAFAILVKGAEDGMYGIDKAGDAIKEFTIRSTDMSTASKAAYEEIGLDAEKMADKILAGGDDAKGAFDKIIDGLLSIESPSKRANTAIALFGTPLEDLSVREIPDFLRSLRDTESGMEDVRGAAKRMGDTLNDNAATRVTAFKRKVQGQLVDFFADDVIPFLEDDLFPALSGIGDALDKVPSWAIKGSVGGLLGLMAAGKLGSLMGNLRGLRGGGGVLGGGGVVSKMTPVPVIVMNPDSLPGDLPDNPRKPKTKPPIIAGGGWLAALTAAGIAGGVGVYGLHRKVAPDQVDKGYTSPAPGGIPAGVLAGDEEGEILDLRDTMHAAVGDMVKTAARGAANVVEAFAILPTELITSFDTDGIPQSRAQARDLVKQYDLTPKEKSTLFELLGYGETMARIGNIDRAATNAARERRLRIAVQYADAGYESIGGIQQYGGTVSAPGPSGRRRIGPGPSPRPLAAPRAKSNGGPVTLKILDWREGLAQVIRGELYAHDDWLDSLGGVG